MSFAIDTQCLLCHLRRNLEVVKPLGTEEQAMAFAKDMMRLYLEAPEGVASPWFNPQTSDLMLKHYGLPIDRMKEEKELSNRFVMERLDLIRQKVESAADPVFAGLQFSILGNYLDFAALQGQVSFEKLDAMLDKAFDMDLDKEAYAALCADLEAGKKLLYLTDNAGEIGFDRIFAEEIAKKYPHYFLRPGRNHHQRRYPCRRGSRGHSLPGHRQRQPGSRYPDRYAGQGGTGGPERR